MNRGLLILVLGGLALLIASSLAMAQEDSASEPRNASPAFLSLSEEVESDADDPSVDCHPQTGHRILRMVEKGPRDAEAERVYTQGHYERASCVTAFQYTAQQGFELGSSPKAVIWIGCDAPTITYNSSATEQTVDWRIQLLHNGNLMGSHAGAWPSQVELCDPDTPPQRLDADLSADGGTGGTLVTAGGTLTLRVYLYSTVSPPENYYIAVQSTETPSALYGEGLPGEIRQSPTSDLVVDPPKRESAAGPGNAAVYPFSIENLGDESQTVTVQVESPEGWMGRATSMEIEIGPGESLQENITVAPPTDASIDDRGRTGVTLESSSERIGFEVLTTVVEGAGTPTEKAADPGFSTGSNESGVGGWVIVAISIVGGALARRAW